MDSVPLVAITGQVGRPMIGTDGFQEADICGITMPITKHNFLVTDPAEIPQTIAAAFHLAVDGPTRPRAGGHPEGRAAVGDHLRLAAGPPSPGLPADHAAALGTDHRRRQADRRRAASGALRRWWGVEGSGDRRPFDSWPSSTGIPVVTTLMARGAFPDSHIQHLGMPGMHGTVAAVAGMQRADVIVALGARFDDRVTGQLSTFAPGATIIHADIDPAEIGKNRVADVPIVGDAREVITELIAAVAAEQAAGVVADLTAWWAELDDLRRDLPARLRLAGRRLAVPAVRHRTARARSPARTRSTRPASASTRCGRPSSSPTRSRGTWLNSGGLGTMGYAVPAAMGAKMGRPEATVWAIDGDGCFQMTNQELATCAIEGIPIKVAIINNGNLGMVRQWQTLFYGERYSQTDLGTHKHRIPDFKMLAEAYGCVGLRCESKEDVDRTIEAAMAINDRPVVVDFVVGADAQVWPMVAAGTGNDQIMAARGIRPLFDEE